jgi:hypothetical protein
LTWMEQLSEWSALVGHQGLLSRLPFCSSVGLHGRIKGAFSLISSVIVFMFSPFFFAYCFEYYYIQFTESLEINQKIVVM